MPTFKYLYSLAHKRLFDGGWSHEVTVRELAIAKTLAGVLMRLTAEAFANCTGTRQLNGHIC